jgi:hypothetical protein
VAVPASAIVVEPVVPCFVAPPQDLAIDVKFDCGYVVVPENGAAPAGRRVKLGYLRLQARASGSAAKASPLFVLAGGPGNSLIQQVTFALFAAPMLGPLLDERDVVILDQRGTAHTQPHLDCPDVYGLAWSAYRQGLGEDAASALQRRVLERCIDGFRRQGSTSRPTTAWPSPPTSTPPVARSATGASSTTARPSGLNSGST